MKKNCQKIPILKVVAIHFGLCGGLELSNWFQKWEISINFVTIHKKIDDDNRLLLGFVFFLTLECLRIGENLDLL